MECEPRWALSPGDHVCAIVRNSHERDLLLVPFLRHGLAAGYKCVVSLPGHDPSTAILAIGGGIDVDRCRRMRQLELVGHPGPSEVRGASDGSELMRCWRQAVSDAAGDGYPAIHLSTTTSGSSCSESSDIDALIDYEARVWALTYTQPVAALCFHDARQADGGRVLALMRTHPRVLIGNVELHNPYYRPAGTRTAP